MLPTAPAARVKLTQAQIRRIKKHITKKGNTHRACAYAGIDTRTFKKALKTGLLKSSQRTAFLLFCDAVEGISKTVEDQTKQAA